MLIDKTYTLSIYQFRCNTYELYIIHMIHVVGERYNWVYSSPVFGLLVQI